MEIKYTVAELVSLTNIPRASLYRLLAKPEYQQYISDGPRGKLVDAAIIDELGDNPDSQSETERDNLRQKIETLETLIAEKDAQILALNEKIVSQDETLLRQSEKILRLAERFADLATQNAQLASQAQALHLVDKALPQETEQEKEAEASKGFWQKIFKR